MKKISKKMRQAMIDRQIQAAVVGLQIPIMEIPAIYKFAEGLIAGYQEQFKADGQHPNREEFVAAVQAFAIEKGATVTA